MADEAELEVNLLQFLQKSFGFDRVVAVGPTEFAVFLRTETESEAQFRPRLVKLRLVLPKAWIVYDLAADALVIAPDGHTPGPRSSTSALEEAAEKPVFREQGTGWKKHLVTKGHIVYVPEEFDALLTTPEARTLLGIPESG
jgi:hypothetical protein